MLSLESALLLLPLSPAIPVVDLAPSAQEQRVSLTPTALLEWASRRETSDPVLSERAYRLLCNDPAAQVRAEARYRLAALLAGQGKLRDAATLLRRLLDEQPGAQRVRLDLAGLQERLGDEDGARRTLRAASAGPLPKEISRLVDKWSEALRSRRPAGLSIEVAIAPDSNINRATRSDRLSTVLGDFAIDPQGKARSGLGVASSASAFRRFSVGDDLSLIARVTGAGRFYRDKQFNQVDLEAALGAEGAFGKARVSLEAAVGQGWFGGVPFIRQVHATASFRRPVGRRAAIGVKLTGSAIDNRLNRLQDGRSVLGELSLERALSSRSGVLLSAAGERFRARDPGYRFGRWEAGATGWQDLGRVTLFGGVALGSLRGDESLALFAAARSDKLMRLSIGGTFRQLGFAGLAPFVRVTHERNDSNIAFYAYRRTRSEVGFRSAF
ncbi:porin family protein [Sphingomonas humi]|uniref:Surface lipoprotein assembly modifier C-terminal domain-containing protein n=1 Tax=Sphingomonas humi TaxID=335630 RepID=A0ABP7SEB2_9SPHN